LGILTSITAYAVQDAIARFERAVDVSLLTEEQRAEATQGLIAGVTERMAQFTEGLKSNVRTLDCGTF
jgi:C4-dicarboxylate-specific signal transduction histidine kinase